MKYVTAWHIKTSETWFGLSDCRRPSGEKNTFSVILGQGSTYSLKENKKHPDLHLVVPCSLRSQTCFEFTLQPKLTISVTSGELKLT